MTDKTSSSLKRLLSMITALPLYFFCCINDSLNNSLILLVSLVITLASLYEYYKIASVNDTKRPFMAAGMVIGILVNIVMYIFAFNKKYEYFTNGDIFDVRVLLLLFVIFIAVIAVLQLFSRSVQNGIYSLATTVFGVVFLVVFYSHIILLRSLVDSVYYVLIFHIVVMSNDTFSYIGGIIFGKHKIHFSVSPNKSWEGYFSGLLFSVISMIVACYVIKNFYGKDLFGYIESVILAIALCILGNIGDLIESAIKRDGSKKDSGSIIPGHGGMWDVYDALIFSIPFFYYYLILKRI